MRGVGSAPAITPGARRRSRSEAGKSAAVHILALAACGAARPSLTLPRGISKSLLICAHAEVREPSALLTPDQRFLRATFTCGQSTPSRKEARSLLALDSEPSEWCGAALYVS